MPREERAPQQPVLPHAREVTARAREGARGVDLEVLDENDQRIVPEQREHARAAAVVRSLRDRREGAQVDHITKVKGKQKDMIRFFRS